LIAILAMMTVGWHDDALAFIIRHYFELHYPWHDDSMTFGVKNNSVLVLVCMWVCDSEQAGVGGYDC
jgi:hypothetical protein